MTSTRGLVWGWGVICALSVGACGGGGDTPVDASVEPPDTNASMDAGHDAAFVPVDAGPMCNGTPTGCESATDATSCSAIMGCAFGSCAGVPTDCHHILDMTTCGAVEGCTWNAPLCRGTPRACGTYTDVTTCNAQQGCTQGTSDVCSGSATLCTALTVASCTSQPGCSLGPPDAFVVPPDAWVAPPPDAWIAPPDAGCASATTTSSIPVHTVEPDHTAGGVRDLGSVHVRAESACGGTDVEATTDATGHLTLDLPDAGAPWAVTFAIAAHSAVSILDITNLAFTGDVRLETLDVPADVRHVASGTVTGAIASGHTLQVDCPDFETTTAMPGVPWSTGFYTGHQRPDAPLLFVALDLDASGRAVNLGSTAPMTRPTTDVSGISIAMPSPAATPTTNRIVVHGATTGVMAGAHSPVPFGVEHSYLDIPFFPYVLTGTAAFSTAGAAGADVVIDLTHFPGPLDVNLYGFQQTGAFGAVMNVWLTDTSTHDVTVAPVTTLTATGTSLGDLGAVGVGAGFDALVVHIGESTTDLPRWRVIADATSGAASIYRIPHLPTGVTLADIGLPAGSTTALPIYVHMNAGRPWTARGSNVSVWQYQYAIGGQYLTVSTAGR